MTGCVRLDCAGSRRLTKSFQVISGRGDGADPSPRAVGGVEVAAGDADQPEPVGPAPASAGSCRSRSLGRRPRWHANPGRRAPGAWIPGDHGVDAPMRQRRRLPGSRRSPGRCRAEVYPRRPGIHLPGNVRRPRAYWRLTRSRQQVIGQMAPTQAARGKDTPNCIQIDREPERSQSRNHGLDSLGSTRAERRHGLQKRRVIVADEIPQDVDLATVLLAG